MTLVRTCSPTIVHILAKRLAEVRGLGGWGAIVYHILWLVEYGSKISFSSTFLSFIRQFGCSDSPSFAQQRKFTLPVNLERSNNRCQIFVKKIQVLLLVKNVGFSD